MTVSRRRFLAGAAAAAGSAALPSTPSPVAAAPIVEAVAPATAPTIQFTRAGLSLNGGETIYATFERLADGVIRVAEDEFGPGELLSFRGNGLGAVFDISQPAVDEDAYVRPDEEDEDADELDDYDYFERYGRERGVEPRYEPASFIVAPGDPYYEAICEAMAEAEKPIRWPSSDSSLIDDEPDDE
jgi:hypothetical protein